MANDIAGGFVRVGAVRFATNASELLPLTGELDQIQRRLDYTFPRHARILTLSNMHLGLEQARLTLSAGDMSYAGTVRRHLHVVVLSDFGLRSSAKAPCDDATYDRCLQQTGSDLLALELAQFVPSLAVGNSRNGVTRWAYSPGCDVDVTPQMLPFLPIQEAVQTAVASHQDSAALCKANHQGVATTETSQAMVAAMRCDKDCAPITTTATATTTPPAPYCPCPIAADVVFMWDVSTSAVNLCLPRCAAPVALHDFANAVVEDFGSRGLLAGTGGRVRVSGITYSHYADIAFGFEDEKDAILKRISAVDLQGQRGGTFIHTALDLASTELFNKSTNQYRFRHFTVPVILVIVSDGQSHIVKSDRHALRDSVNAINKTGAKRFVFQVGTEHDAASRGNLALLAGKNANGTADLLYTLQCQGAQKNGTDLATQLWDEIRPFVPCTCARETDTPACEFLEAKDCQEDAGMSAAMAAQTRASCPELCRPGEAVEVVEAVQQPAASTCPGKVDDAVCAFFPEENCKDSAAVPSTFSKKLREICPVKCGTCPRAPLPLPCEDDAVCRGPVYAGAHVFLCSHDFTKDVMRARCPALCEACVATCGGSADPEACAAVGLTLCGQGTLDKDCPAMCSNCAEGAAKLVAYRAAATGATAACSDEPDVEPCSRVTITDCRRPLFGPILEELCPATCQRCAAEGNRGSEPPSLVCTEPGRYFLDGRCVNGRECIAVGLIPFDSDGARGNRCGDNA